MSLTVKRLSKRYGTFTALSEIDFDILTGESVGLIGLNGAGKTTLLKTIVGLIVNFEGKVLVHNREANTREAKSHISFLPEDFFPPHYLTGYDFISYMLRLYGRSLHRKEVDECAGTLELQEDILSKPIRTYSKGMRQKLGLMAVILPDTEIVVLDEPLSGLDPGARMLVKDAFIALRKKGKTLFFSSHILTDLEEIADRLVIIHEGKKILDGTPEKLRSYSGRSLEDAFLNVICPQRASAS